LNSPALLRFLEALRAGLEKQLDSRGTRRKSERGYEYSVFFAGHCSSMSCRTVPRSWAMIGMGDSGLSSLPRAQQRSILSEGKAQAAFQPRGPAQFFTINEVNSGTNSSARDPPFLRL